MVRYRTVVHRPPVVPYVSSARSSVWRVMEGMRNPSSLGSGDQPSQMLHRLCCLKTRQILWRPFVRTLFTFSNVEANVRPLSWLPSLCAKGMHRSSHDTGLKNSKIGTKLMHMAGMSPIVHPNKIVALPGTLLYFDGGDCP